MELALKSDELRMRSLFSVKSDLQVVAIYQAIGLSVDLQSYQLPLPPHFTDSLKLSTNLNQKLNVESLIKYKGLIT